MDVRTRAATPRRSGVAAASTTFPARRSRPFAKRWPHPPARRKRWKLADGGGATAMFRRGEEERHDPIEPREVRMADASGSEVTVVGQGARIEGTLVSAGSLRIDGQV